MSQDAERIEIVRELYRSFRERDNAAAFALYDENIVWDCTASRFPGLDSVYRGHDGIRKFWRDWLEAWEEITWEQSEPEALPDGRILVRINNQHNVGKGTGIDIQQRDYEQVWTIEDGKVTRMDMRWAD